MRNRLLHVLALVLLPAALSAAGREARLIEHVPFTASPAAIARMKTPISRSAMVQSLMANTAGRTMVMQQAGKLGLASDKLGTLANKSIQKIASAIASTSSVNSAYAAIDWSSGLTFSPFQSPVYAGFHVGDTSTGHAIVQSYSEGLRISTGRYDPDYGYPVGYTFCVLKLELPMQPMAYQVSIMLTDKEGNCPAAWLQTPAGAPRPWVGARVYYWDAQNQKQVAEGGLIAPLITGNGYTGIFNVNPTGFYKPSGGYPSNQPPTMRRYNCLVEVCIGKDPTTPLALDCMLFGGITIALL